MTSTIVLKFGGSFLRGPADLVRAVHSIYTHVRRGDRVVAITSAFHGRTDELERSLRALDADRGARSSRHVRAALLGTGEVETASLLTAALQRSGVPTRLADVTQVGPFVAPGTEEPVRLATAAFEALLEQYPVVVLPGFIAVEDTDERSPALLGRGGSDLSAVFVAEALGARCVLVKDVDGLYTADPAGRTMGRTAGADAPRRLARVSFDDALGLGAAILQPRAIHHAAEYGHPFDVVGPRHVAGVRGTHVGVRSTIQRSEPAPPRPLRVALLGLGTVGGRVFTELQARPDLFEVTSVLVRRVESRNRPEAVRDVLTDRWSDVLASAPDLIVEATGGVEPAATWIREALVSGVHVVTANKATLAQADPPLESAAAASGVDLLGSAAVGGALPALEPLRRRVATGADVDDPVVGFEGVLNGTTNAVLDQIAAGATLANAVAAAQADGLAEADPQDDLDGTDVANKLELLARAARWTRAGAMTLRWLERQGIDESSLLAARKDADGDDGRLRLVGSVRLSDTGPTASVTLRAVGPGTPFHDLRGAENALALEHASGRIEVVYGTGAGAWPTATAVMGDVFAVARRVATVQISTGRSSARNSGA